MSSFPQARRSQRRIDEAPQLARSPGQDDRFGTTVFGAACRESPDTQGKEGVMTQFERDFLQGMKKKLQVDLIGVASVDQSPELKERAAVFLPTAKSVVVFAKESYKAVVALLGPSKEAGAAEPGEVLGAHAAYIYGRLNRAIHEVADLFAEGGVSIDPPVRGARVHHRPTVCKCPFFLQACGRPGRVGDPGQKQPFDHARIRSPGPPGLPPDGGPPGGDAPGSKKTSAPAAMPASASVPPKPFRNQNRDSPTPSIALPAGPTGRRVWSAASA